MAARVPCLCKGMQQGSARAMLSSLVGELKISWTRCVTRFMQLTHPQMHAFEQGLTVAYYAAYQPWPGSRPLV